MKLLLDTHALLWALTDNALLSRRAAAFIGDPDSQILVSAVSAYEICAKHTLGRLPEAADLAADFQGVIGPLAADWLPITSEHAVAAGKLDRRHRDPFDRLLIAQAMVERVPLVSNEKLLDIYGIERIW